MPEITSLLAKASRGDARAENALFDAVYAELRGLARGVLWREHTVSQLDPAGLVSEAWLKMNGRTDLAFENRHLFYAYASRVMRSVVLDQVRERVADKRGGGLRAVTLTTALEDTPLQGPGLVAIDRALTSLRELDPRSHDAFEMHFFAGMDVADICVATARSPATVKRDLRKARAFLFDELGVGETG
jgi:RNA polymerase sigma factor (TIGR02999 family)